MRGEGDFCWRVEGYLYVTIQELQPYQSAVVPDRIPTAMMYRLLALFPFWVGPHYFGSLSNDTHTQP